LIFFWVHISILELILAAGSCQYVFGDRFQHQAVSHIRKMKKRTSRQI
jgi:hypothetical protein